MSHTPGPWRTAIRRGYVSVFSGPPDNAEMVADCSNLNLDSKERIANCNLIALTPELLESLELAVQYWRWMVEDNPNQAGETEREELRRCETVLAKAKGDPT